MHLEHSPLEILHGVGLAVDVALLLELVGDRIALLGQSAVAVPVRQELATYSVTRSGGTSGRSPQYSPSGRDAPPGYFIL